MFLKVSQKGQALLLIALGVIGLIGFTALAVDGGRIYSEKQNAQNAADGAALAAALAKVRGNDYTDAAQRRAEINGYGSNTVSVTTASTAPGVCPTTGTEITVTITSHLPLLFAPVVGWTENTSTSTASARACDVKVSGGVPLYAGASVMATKKAICGNGQKDKAIFVQGSSQVQFWGGGVASASPDGDCLDFTGGEAQFKKAESGTACADILTASSSGGDFSHAKGQDGCGKVIRNQTFADPPAAIDIQCDYNWTGKDISNATTLQPGTHCVTGAFTVNGNGKLTGNGVTIVMKSGNLHWNGSMEVKLSAPGSGPYKGLLIYFPPSNKDDVDINGNSNSLITGTILAQNSPCYFAGSSQLQKQKLQFICYTWGMNGSAQGQLEYDASQFYSPLQVQDPTITLIK